MIPSANLARDGGIQVFAVGLCTVGPPGAARPLGPAVAQRARDGAHPMSADGPAPAPASEHVRRHVRDTSETRPTGMAFFTFPILSGGQQSPAGDR